MGKSTVKQVIIIRKDLKMRRGKEIAQGSHASLAVILNNLVGYPFSPIKFPFLILKFLYLFTFKKAFRLWLTTFFAKVCVVVSSEEELLKCYNEAKNQGLLCSLIRDRGLTEFGGVPTYTTVAIGPDYSEKIDNITGKLQLY